MTLLVPYYTIDEEAPLPDVFDRIGLDWARYVITIGALAGLTTSLLDGMFPMPRIIYSMASDGLLFHFLTYVSDRFKTPVLATLLSGSLAGIIVLP